MIAAAPVGIDPQRLLESTIRLTVADAGGKSKGTGVIVDARNGMALALTCGHLFRESAGRGPIEISLFAADAGNPRCTGVVAGELLDYDLDRDLALIRFAVPGSVAVAPVAPLGTLLEPGASVASVGCDQGADPTVWSTRLTAVNRFQGHPNVEAARAPVEGRSGGPLFNAAGQVIGICFAADPQSDEGLYASLPSIHAKLDELQLSMVYQTPSAGPGGGVAPGAALAAAATPAAVAPPAAAAPPAELLAVRGQSPPAPPSTGLVGSWPAAAAPTAGGPIAAPAPHLHHRPAVARRAGRGHQDRRRPPRLRAGAARRGRRHRRPPAGRRHAPPALIGRRNPTVRANRHRRRRRAPPRPRRDLSFL